VTSGGAATGDTPEPRGVALEAVEVRYPGRREPALADVSLAVGRGDVVGVAGRTGAGKSTLALLAAGFIPRVVRATVAGRAAVDGIPATGLDAGALAGRVGIVFSTPANQLSASKLTVREELAFGLENLGVSRDAMDSRIDAVLSELGIEHLAGREPFALSGGEQQRVAIASIVVMGTGALVLDEPTAQLDPAGTRQIAELLRATASEGRAVLCVEHDPTVLGRTDRCVVLDGGRMVGVAAPGEALGSGILGTTGVPVPTLVRLAEWAGVDPGLAFDEDAVARRLRASSGRGKPAPRTAGSTLDWTPVLERTGLALEVRGITHRYPRGVEALRGVDLAIGPGEVVAIVGQNGSGKTTLAKHLDGLLRPDTGSVAVGGRDIAGLPVHETARSVGFVFQNPDDQLFNRSVEREVAFGPRNLGLVGASALELVERALELTGLVAVRATNPYDLGLSMRKLVALASVLAMEPQVLVLDEPTTGQDGPGVERVGAIVDAYRRDGRTVVAITHDMEFAARHFGRIVVMQGGRVVADGTPLDIFSPGRAHLLESTGLEPPVSARLGARTGLGSTPTPDALIDALAVPA
jgi:energy-coupling factor transporter ATP-binding protein EcfA2